MLCKNALTAIDHNMNTDRAQGKTSSGIPQFDLVSNRDGSKFFVKPILAQKDMSWRDAIASAALQAYQERKVPAFQLPIGSELKTRGKKVEKPDKDTAISKHQTRMKMT
eukprot:GFUD01136999.1.p1 GENE.GFUD01136999.1~~GFUD01136999.1.p1  ORF type:complete len:109 (+),score=23.50 GFUD01136999.1:109-435(+)